VSGCDRPWCGQLVRTRCSQAAAGLDGAKPDLQVALDHCWFSSLRGVIARTRARMAEAELRVDVGPRATRLAIKAAISSKLSGTGFGAAFRGSRWPPEGPAIDSIGTPESRSLARSRSTVRRPTPSCRASTALDIGSRTAPRSSTSRCCLSTRLRVRWLSRDSAARCRTAAAFGPIRGSYSNSRHRRGSIGP
jgi:hypothetical protein